MGGGSILLLPVALGGGGWGRGRRGLRWSSISGCSARAHHSVWQAGPPLARDAAASASRLCGCGGRRRSGGRQWGVAAQGGGCWPEAQGRSSDGLTGLTLTWKLGRLPVPITRRGVRVQSLALCLKSSKRCRLPREIRGAAAATHCSLRYAYYASGWPRARYITFTLPRGLTSLLDCTSCFLWEALGA